MHLCHPAAPGHLAPMERGALVVVLDMSLAVLTVVMNLVVLTALKEGEAAKVALTNLLLGNLCLSNLASAALVKAISIVHNGWAVQSHQPISHLSSQPPP